MNKQNKQATLLPNWSLTWIAVLLDQMLEPMLRQDNMNKNSRTLTPKDLSCLHELIYQFQFLATWILLPHSFRFSTISTSKFKSFTSLFTPTLEVIAFLLSLSAPTFYFRYQVILLLCTCTIHLKKFSFMFSSMFANS